MTKFCLMFFVSAILAMNFTGCINVESNTHNQNSYPDVFSNPSGSKGPFQGLIKSDSKLELATGKNNDEKIDNTSFGKIFLVFLDSNKNEFKTEIPAEAMFELNLYLRERLKFCIIKGPSDNSSAVRRDRNLMLNANKTKNRLIEIQIDTPEGKRKISYEEAGKLIEYVGISTFDLCQLLNEER